MYNNRKMTEMQKANLMVVLTIIIVLSTLITN